MKKVYLFICALFLGCAHHHEKMPKESDIAISKSLQGHRWGNIYFSGQPDQKTLKALKRKGFKTVINLREKREGAYQEPWERKLVTTQGLNYYNLPFSMKNEMTDEYISLVTSKIKEHRKEGKILVHCSSGNRVGVWLGAHFKKDHGFSNEKSMTLAKELGLKKEKAQRKLNNYLTR